MNKLNIKICGMRESENCRAVAELQPDFMGFIFYPHSPRFVGYNFCLPAKLPSTMRKVGVFVNEQPVRIKEIVQRCRLDAVQLHGNERAEVCASVKEFVPVVIKAFAVHEGFCFDEVKPYVNSVDYFLFDAKGHHPGGNGLPFNWGLLQEYKYSVPFFLSGGIDVSNLGRVVGLNHPQLAGVDLNSGFEVSPGLKNVRALREAFTMLNEVL
ncbi:MAG: phosphoribosylanthranilate isomerase [Cyclobacteriaceae bacterium]